MLSPNRDRVDEHTEPAVTQSPGSSQCGRRPPTDDDRHRWLRNGTDQRCLEGERVALVIDRLAVEQAADETEGFAHAPASGRRIDATIPHFGRIVAAGADAEHESTGRRELGDRSDLTGDGNRMAQGEQVHRRLHPDRPGERSDDRGLDQTVVSLPAPEADVVADPDTIEPSHLHRGGETRQVVGARAEQTMRDADADLDGRAHRRSLIRDQRPASRSSTGAMGSRSTLWGPEWSWM